MLSSPESPTNEDNSEWEDISDSDPHNSHESSSYDEYDSHDDDACCIDYHDSIYFEEGITPPSIPVDPCPYWEYTWSNVLLTRNNDLTLSPSFIQLPKQVKAIRLGVSSFDLQVSEDVNIYCYLNHRERQMGWAIKTVTCMYQSDKMVELKSLEEYDGGDEMLGASITDRSTDEGSITLTFRFFLEKSVGPYVYHLCDMRLGKDLWETAVNKQMTDVVFLVGHRSFAAHKFLLAARSPVFAAMFDTDMVESRTGRVIVDDVDPDTFQQFLRFLYTGQLEEPASEELLLVADKYDVKTLTDICESASFFFNMDTDDSFDSVGSATAAAASDPSLLPFEVQRKADSFWINEDVSVTTGDPSSVVCEEQGQSLVVPMFFHNSAEFSFRHKPHFFRGSIVKPDQICLSGGRTGQHASRIVEVFCTSKRYIIMDDTFLYFTRMKPFNDPNESVGPEPTNQKFTVTAYPKNLPWFNFLVCHSPSIPDFRYAFRDWRLIDNLWKSSVNKEWTDVDFVVGDKTFSAHRALLAARCPALIPPGPNLSSSVKVENLKSSVFEDLLYFVHTGKLKTCIPSEALYEAALTYEVGLLQRLFEMRHPKKIADTSPDFPMG